MIITKGSNNDNYGYFGSLTGIRAVAATMVFLHHYNIFTAAKFGDFIYRFVAEFHVGVTIFFVLSGFLITYRYYDKVILKRGWLHKYFINRFARIYPVYFIVTLIYSLPLVCKCDFRDNFHVLILNLTFLRGYFEEYRSTLATTGWSLTVEETFYFLFPLIVFLSSKIKLAFQFLILFSFGMLLWLIFKDVNFHGFMSSLTFVFEFSFFGRCFEFFVGIYFALFLKSSTALVADKRGCFKTLVGAFYICICIALLSFNHKVNEGNNAFIWYETLINNFILPPGIALLFYGLITEHTLVRKILESRVFIILGKSSYVFYLIHNGILFSILYTYYEVKTWYIFIILQVISVLLYYFLEKPLNNYFRKFGENSQKISS